MSRVRAPSFTPRLLQGNSCSTQQKIGPVSPGRSSFNATLTGQQLSSAVCQARNVAQAIEDTELQTTTQLDSPWVTIVWNDPVNLMSYVSWVFRSYFGFAHEEAERLMLQVHHDGRSVVATGSREEMERHVEAMHDFGLWATLQKADA